MSSKLRTDPKHLTEKMYSNESQLSTRIRTHELYTQPKQDFTAWVLDQITWHGIQRVMDVGCGAGFYIQPLHNRLAAGSLIISADLSLGMLRDVAAKPFAAHSNLLNANVHRIPLPEASLDVVLANHMLYHVPDIPAALAEVRRVLRPGGFLLAATNSVRSMTRFKEEIQAAYHQLGFPIQFPDAITDQFSLENGQALLQQAFPDVRSQRFESALVFPEAAPVCAYVNSLYDGYAPDLPDQVSWEQVLRLVEEHVKQIIQQEGEYRVEKTTGMFIAQKEG